MNKIKKVAVIGSGIMGSGIAALFASAGIKTLLLDIIPPDLTEKEKLDPLARNRIVASGFENLSKAKPAALMHPDDIKRITIGNLDDDFEKLADCDWIIEVVVENLQIKQNLLKRIEPTRKKGSIVSTNTSGIPLKNMSSGMSREFRQHFLGTHFFNPVRYMHLLELIPGEDTLPEILDMVMVFGERILGKGIVWAKDTPNFVGNRIGVHGLLLAMHALVDHDLRVSEADAILGPAMGRPKTAIFKTADLVGLDTLGHVAQNTYQLVADDEDKETFKLPEYVARMIQEKRFGKKTDGGFYKKVKGQDGKNISLVMDPSSGAYMAYTPAELPCLEAAKKQTSLKDQINAMLRADDKGSRYAWTVLAGSLAYAAKRVPEIADTIADIDNAMKWGYNYQLGPFESWDAIGVAWSVSRMEKEDIRVPENVKKMIQAGNTSFYRFEKGQKQFYDLVSQTYKNVTTNTRSISLQNLVEAGKLVRSCRSGNLVDLGDGVYCCEFKTKMNSLNSELIDFIHESLDYVDSNGTGMVIGNQPTGAAIAFSAGANLVEVVNAARNGRFDDIRRLIHRMQAAVQRIRYESFPVVAAPYGLTLGAGCEICLGADRIVAHTELYMGLVETGVGLIPAGGGCLNTWKKYIGTLPESVKNIDLTAFFIPVLTNIAKANVSTSAADAKSMGYLGAMDRIVFNRDLLIGEAKDEVLKMLSDGYAPPLPKKVTVLGNISKADMSVVLDKVLGKNTNTDFDIFLGECIANIIRGGNALEASEIDEQVILDLEAETFMKLLKEQKTIERISHMLQTGKPLRN